jgi:hypothetical protein
VSRDLTRKEPPSVIGPEPSEFILYQTEDGLARVEIRLHDGTVWLTQKQLADLYQVSVPSVSEHIRNIFSEGELAPEATVRKFRTVRTEGNVPSAVEGHFDEAVREVEALAKKRPTKRRKGGG